MISEDQHHCDIVIVGGGLAGGLAYLALRQARPAWDIRLIEPDRVGGNHVWSFFDGDISPDGLALLQPLVAHRWDHYDVRFPAFSRKIDMAYNSITGERLAEAVAHMQGGSSGVIAARAAVLTPDAVTFDDGTVLRARHVVDARGFDDLSMLDCGWQKFVGQALRIAGGHGLTAATVMDATVAQIDGYRFVYCLPLDAETVFVEDTYYSDGPELDVEAVGQRIAAYAQGRGWQVEQVSRQETGVLPVVMAGDFDRLWPETDGVARVGVRAGCFHATTGYSLPFAVESALALVAALTGGSGGVQDAPADVELGGLMRGRAQDHWRVQRYYRLLSTMLFRAAEPEKRYPIFQRFYGLSPALIARFYAGHSHLGDRLRILAGKPPVPIGRAMMAIKDLHWI